jgi:hypothetical protein
MNRKLIIKTVKAHKILTGILGLIITLVGIFAIYKQYSRKDITGNWKMTFKNLESSFTPYVGETHTQKVYFTQNEAAIIGNGEKWEYNGKLLPFDQHRKIEYQGIVDSDKLKANYKLYGLKRETTGCIDIIISSDGKTLSGNFSGTAGDTKGTVFGEKID